jgi:hypothetical protein
VLHAVTVTNPGTINLSGASGGSGAEIYVSGSVMLTGGGKVVLSPSGNNTIEAGGITNTLINANNTITGAGTVGAIDLRLINSGRIEAPVSALTISSLVINVGTMAAVSGGVLRVAAGGTNSGTLSATSGSEVDVFGSFTNSKIIVASAGGTANLTSSIIVNGIGGVVLASGASAHVNLDVATIFGGTLKTSGGGQITAFDGNTLSNVTLAASSLLIDINNGILTLKSGTIGAGAIIETSGGTAIVSGTVTNGGTLFASAAGDLIEIASGAVVNGGLALIGNGIVDIAGSSGESVKFLSTGSGGLEIADTSGHTSAFSGRVSGFGGSAHSNKVQFIDLVSVTSTLNTISLSYVSAASHTSGTLFVSSGGAVVAAINMVGAYTSANFSALADSNGKVKIIDPTVPNGGTVSSDTINSSMPHSGIDLPDIAFGAHTTLAYTANAAGTGGTLTVSDGRHTAAIALLGNYMAGSFVAVADGHGGTLITQGLTGQPLLTHPPRG